MKEQSTEALMNILKGTPSSKFQSFQNALKALPSFYVYFNEYIGKHQLNTADVIEKSQLTRSTAYAILDGSRPNPSRDRVIALCIAAGMSLEDLQYALRTCQHGVLYVKFPRDAAIIKCLQDGKTSVQEINEFLYAQGEPPLQLSR